MPRTYNEALIMCPFYRSMASKSISCEGITDDCFIMLIFMSAEMRDQHRKIFCEKNYKNCEICRMLREKYEE